MILKKTSLKIILFTIGFFVLLFLGLLINLHFYWINSNLETMSKTLTQQILYTRQWAADYGGVWVNNNEGSYYKAENGMYLKTPYMMSTEISNMVSENEHYSFRLASDKPVNPMNYPSEYEQNALNSFNEGAIVIAELNRSKKQYRYIVPIYVEESCLSCHEEQGYREGELRGLLSVTIPADDTLKSFYFGTFLYIIGALITFSLASYTSINWVTNNYIHPLSAMHKKANTDFLTGLYNHGYFQQKFKELFLNFEEKQISLLFVDIDNFKLVNDTYGHDIGDKVLKELAKVFRTAIRDNDILARYGGEEFAIILPETNSKIAKNIANRLLAKVREHTIVTKAVPLNITVSIGIATKTKDTLTPKDMIVAADRALYYAKNTGKNRFSDIY